MENNYQRITNKYLIKKYFKLKITKLQTKIKLLKILYHISLVYSYIVHISC